MKRAAFIAFLVAALLAPSAEAQESRSDPSSALRALLKARSDAQLRNDRAAYAATIDPEAPAGFREAQLRSFDGLAALPVRELAYSIRDDELDLTRGVDADEYGGAPVALIPTTRTLRFTYDARNSVDSLFWTFVRRGRSWYVGGDDDVKDLGLETAVAMWDVGPVVVEQSEHFQFVAHPQQRSRARELLGTAERASAILGPRWSLPWSGKVIAFLPRSPDELGDMIQAGLDVTKYVAFVGYGYHPDTLEPTTPRLFVQDANLSAYSAASQTETLLHELTHAAGSAYASTFMPAWLHEGLADWIAGGTTGRYPRGPGAGQHAPRDEDFSAGSQGEIVRAYRDARSLVAALARLAGPNAPFALFQALGATNVRPGAAPHVLDEALRKLGVADLGTLEREWVAGR